MNLTYSSKSPENESLWLIYKKVEKSSNLWNSLFFLKPQRLLQAVKIEGTHVCTYVARYSVLCHLAHCAFQRWQKWTTPKKELLKWGEITKKHDFIRCSSKLIQFSRIHKLHQRPVHTSVSSVPNALSFLFLWIIWIRDTYSIRGTWALLFLFFWTC